MIWRKPYRIYVGQPLMSTSAVAHTKCGFKLLHTIHHIIHMDNSVQWTMTPHGRNCLTTTSYHILPVNSTSGHTTLTVHGDSAWSTPTLQACWVLLQEMSTFGCWRRRSSTTTRMGCTRKQWPSTFTLGKRAAKKTVVWKSLRETANYTTFFDLHVHCLWFGDVLQQFSMSFWFSFSRIFDTSWHHLTRPTSLWFETSRASTLNLLVLLGDLCIHPLAMSISNTVGPAEAPWDTPDPVTCIRHLQSLVGLGFNIVQVIFKTLSKRLWVASARKWTNTWTIWAQNMWNTRQIISFSARWFDFGSARLLLSTRIKSSKQMINYLNLIMSTISGTRCGTFLDGGSRKFGNPMMDGCWWLRRKNLASWSMMFLLFLIKDPWLKRLSALRVAWSPIANHWWLTWAKEHCKLSFIYQKTHWYHAQDLVLLVEIATVWHQHPDQQLPTHCPMWMQQLLNMLQSNRSKLKYQLHRKMLKVMTLCLWQCRTKAKLIYKIAIGWHWQTMKTGQTRCDQHPALLAGCACEPSQKK